MTIRPPAEIGMALEDVDTPALLVDLDAFENNVALMAKMVASFGVNHRPHAKTHKSPDVARRQIAAGAVGQCCQKVGEAEVLVAGGIQDVLVSNQIVGRRKLDRLAALARQAQVGAGFCPARRRSISPRRSMPPRTFPSAACRPIRAGLSTSAAMASAKWRSTRRAHWSRTRWTSSPRLASPAAL
jgi:hypothetical protein